MLSLIVIYSFIDSELLVICIPPPRETACNSDVCMAEDTNNFHQSTAKTIMTRGCNNHVSAAICIDLYQLVAVGNVIQCD